MCLAYRSALTLILSSQRKHSAGQENGGKDLRLWAHEGISQAHVNHHDDGEDRGYAGVHGARGAAGRDHAKI